MQKTERLIAIVLLLQARGKMTAQRLAHVLGVSPRTVYRDIITLSLAHVPISMEYGPGGGYYLPADYHFESAIFTREEAISLILSTDFSGSHSLFADDIDLHHALLKLEAFLPAEYQQDVNAARKHILVDTSDWRNQIDTPTYLEIIRDALLAEKQMEICYPCGTCSKPGCSWKRIEPQGLVFKGVKRRHVKTGHWYLVAFCWQCQAMENFCVNEIEQLIPREEPITPRPDFNLRSYWREACRYLDVMKSST